MDGERRKRWPLPVHTGDSITVQVSDAAESVRVVHVATDGETTSMWSWSFP